MILWSLDVRSPPLDVVAVHRVGEPLVTPLVWRTLSCYLLPVILLPVARGVCVYSNASNHRCKLRDFLDSIRCEFAVFRSVIPREISASQLGRVDSAGSMIVIKENDFL